MHPLAVSRTIVAWAPTTEMMFSGEPEVKADDQISGAHLASERFAEYRPRENGTPERTTGPKIAYFHCVEWMAGKHGSSAGGGMRRT